MKEAAARRAEPEVEKDSDRRDHCLGGGQSKGWRKAQDGGGAPHGRRWGQGVGRTSGTCRLSLDKRGFYEVLYFLLWEVLEDGQQGYVTY